jgi:hypothetical protein
MKVTCVAKNDGIAERTISIEKLENGDYKIVTLVEECGSDFPNYGLDNIIEMEFTQQGINALLGTLMAVTGNLPVQNTIEEQCIEELESAKTDEGCDGDAWLRGYDAALNYAIDVIKMWR